MPAVAEIIRRLGERQRAGTRPAPTFCCLGAEGRHEACPYLLLFGGQRAGIRPDPTGALGGRAGTRPAPTFAVWRAEVRYKACPYLQMFGTQRAGTRPAPTGALGGRAGTGACPYCSWSGRRCDMYGGLESAVYSVADREREGL